MEVHGKEIIIKLPSYCIEDKFQRSLNLAHEIAHTLTPVGDSNKVTYLDEGLSTAFSEKYLNCNGTALNRYKYAGELVRTLLDIDPKIIKKMRTKHPDKTLSEYTGLDFTSVAPLIDTSLINDLMKLFQNS